MSHSVSDDPQTSGPHVKLSEGCLEGPCLLCPIVTRRRNIGVGLRNSLSSSLGSDAPCVLGKLSFPLWAFLPRLSEVKILD